jgi:hypothetical protein
MYVVTALDPIFGIILICLDNQLESTFFKNQSLHGQAEIMQEL